MNKIKILGFLIIILVPVSVVAQVSPIPVVENEIRNGTSTRMRSNELERLKRDAKKIGTNSSDIEKKIKFVEIREDFESIQKQQDKIIKAYTKGKKINYSKIAKYAQTLNKNAHRLKSNLFTLKNSSLTEDIGTETPLRFEQSDVRSLIIELDSSIGDFIFSPIFKDLKTVDLEASKIAQGNIEKIISLSQILIRFAEELK